MSFIVSLLVFLVASVVFMVCRASGKVLSIGLAVVLFLITGLSGLGVVFNVIMWLAFLVLALPLNVGSIRRQYITSRVLRFYKHSKPAMSNTEKEALESGTVGWEGDLFAGSPDWSKLYAYTNSELTDEEQAYLDNEVERLCEKINNWEINITPVGLPGPIWSELLNGGFFGMKIPKEYGGLGFSSRAYSAVIGKIASANGSVGTVSSVPNSLGPGELLLHYGTEEQKDYYLPRLASGKEVPCFALTSPLAGSDAGAMQDFGVVCEAELQGIKQLCIRLNFSKRYITLAPVATILGLAFKLYDPDHLLGAEDSIGITCAIIPVSTPGIRIGRHHLPLNAAFPNGPVQGRDVLISVNQIIGGRAQAGSGWRMLMECLADGRGVSIPSIVTGGVKTAVLATGAYARIRKQFNCSLNQFEGVATPLSEMVSLGVLNEAMCRFVTSSLDAGERPAVAAGISKLHVGEMGRVVVNHAMDINAGRAICLGPNNYMSQYYIETPIGITVEGANILTRNMIIFGQGAVRCHPFILKEMKAAAISDKAESLKQFDDVFFGHAMYYLQNIANSLWLGLSGARTVKTVLPKLAKYERIYSRYSAVLAMLTDTTIITLGAALKRCENLSARLGDLLSYLYLGSAALKFYHDNQSVDGLLDVMHCIHQDLCFKLQQTVSEILDNLPMRFKWLFRFYCFPLGKRIKAPSDHVRMKVAKLIAEPSALRDCLMANLYMAPNDNNPAAKLNAALQTLIDFDPIEKKIMQAVKKNELDGYCFDEWLASAKEKQVVTEEEYEMALGAYRIRMELITVDDFSYAELMTDYTRGVADRVTGETADSTVYVKDVQ